MHEKDFYISSLLASAIKGDVTADQQLELDQWLAVSLKRKQLYKKLQSEEFIRKELTVFSHTDKGFLWSKIQSAIATTKDEKIIPVKKIWTQWTIAAAILCFTFVATLIFYSNYQKYENALSLIRYDRPPGISGATLTLANGQKIRLSQVSKGEIAIQGNMHISKTDDGRLIYEQTDVRTSDSHSGGYNTLSTDNGESYVLVLPDHSKVWINAASSISYSADLFDDGKRLVKLKGEAYFEVAKDSKHPFIVESTGQRLEVLGTHFNINAYPDEPQLSTTLLEGSVKINTRGLAHTLRPGQQLLNSGEAVKIVLANLDNVTDWKEGDFFLNHVEFKSAMRKIARWYNVEIIYDKSVPSDMQAGGWISRNQPLSTVLRSIESSGLVKFRLEGRKIFVSR